ncbi:hypothetical protein [Micromonospora sp. NPDC092111]|uniref:hypothetical protein n=1 Tax=Micromonospora sp. NPDC092111 TaxID=3364289 RepID=UPI00382A4603
MGFAVRSPQTGGQDLCFPGGDGGLVQLQEDPSPRSSVAGAQVGRPSRVSLTSRLARSLTRSISSMRVKPITALTFFIRFTAMTRCTCFGRLAAVGISVTISPLASCCCANRLGFCR